MKIIDLLNKIANEKKIPQKIKFNTYVYSWHDKEHGYCRYERDNFYICLNSEYYLFDILNDEVEIIEEEKKIPEKLEDYDFDDGLDANTKCECLRERMQEIENQLDEIIDYLKSKGE